MNRFTVLSLVLSFLAVDAVSSSEIGNYVTPCKRYSEDLKQCIVNAWEAIRPNLAGGIPKFKVPPLDPFILQDLSLKRTSETLDLKGTLTKLKFMGVRNVKFSNLNVDPSDFTGSVNLEFVSLNVTTFYDLEGSIMKSTPMRGVGRFNGTFSDINANVTIKGQRSEKNQQGKSYLNIKKIKVKMTVGDAKGRLEDTSKNQRNEAFTKTVNSYLSHNKRDVLNMFTPMMEQLSEKLIQEVLNEILTTIPYEDIIIE